MPSTTPPEILGPFLAAADAAASSRPDVDAETARGLMAEAAGVLHDGPGLHDPAGVRTSSGDGVLMS